MGLIKALTNATSTALGDQFKEFVNCPTIDRNVIIQRGVVTHGEGNYNPLQYSCLRNPMDRGAWQATVHGVPKSQT